MLSKAQNKYIRSLSQQKYRKEHNVFIAEGDKIAAEWLASDQMVEMIVAVQEWADAHEELIHKHSEASLHIVSEETLKSISLQQTPNKVLLVVRHMPQFPEIQPDGWCLALDELQDPGNMGTIIRIADWFGITDIVCSRGCVDAWNPKVIQSAMGGHLRVNIHYTDLKSFLEESKLPVFAAALDGVNVYEAKREKKGILVIGNESKGISAEIMELADERITIPRRGGAESLNAGVSAGILCALLLPH